MDSHISYVLSYCFLSKPIQTGIYDDAHDDNSKANNNSLVVFERERGKEDYNSDDKHIIFVICIKCT